jgi:predicted Zn-dependent protease
MIRSDKARLFQLVLQDEFKLKSRVNFAKTKVLRFDGDSCMGMYEGEKLSAKRYNHKIRVATSEVKSDLDLFSTLAHEYVHAWQMEHGYDLGHDTKTGFTQWRDYFSKNYAVDLVSF